MQKIKFQGHRGQNKFAHINAFSDDNSNSNGPMAYSLTKLRRGSLMFLAVATQLYKRQCLSVTLLVTISHRVLLQIQLNSQETLILWPEIRFSCLVNIGLILALWWPKNLVKLGFLHVLRKLHEPNRPKFGMQVYLDHDQC